MPAGKQPVPAPRCKKKEVITQQPETYNSPFYRDTSDNSFNIHQINTDINQTWQTPHSQEDELLRSNFYDSSFDTETNFINIDLKKNSTPHTKPKPKPRPRSINKYQHQIISSNTLSSNTKPPTIVVESRPIYQNAKDYEQSNLQTWATANKNVSQDSTHRIPSVYEESSRREEIPSVYNSKNMNLSFYNRTSFMESEIKRNHLNKSFEMLTDSLLYENNFQQMSSLFLKLHNQISLQESQNHRENTVNKILAIKGPFSQKYCILPIKTYLWENEHLVNENRLPQILGMLEQYSSNLLIPIEKRHHLWRRIPKSTPTFIELKAFKDSVNILQEIGYVDSDNFFIFPENMHVNKERVLDIATDLCIAKYEISHIKMRTHIYQDDLNKDPDLPPYLKNCSTNNFENLGNMQPMCDKQEKPIDQALISKFTSNTNQNYNLSIQKDKFMKKDTLSKTTPDGFWSCFYCTLTNPNSVKICQICNKSKLASDDSRKLESSNRNQNDLVWVCAFCTCKNDLKASSCQACNKPRDQNVSNKKPSNENKDINTSKVGNANAKQQPKKFETVSKEKENEIQNIASYKNAEEDNWQNKKLQNHKTEYFGRKTQNESENFNKPDSVSMPSLNQQLKDEHVSHNKEKNIKDFDSNNMQKWRDVEVARRKELEIEKFDKQHVKTREKRRLEREQDTERMNKLMQLLKVGEDNNFFIEETLIAAKFIKSLNTVDVLAWLKNTLSNNIKDLKEACDRMDRGELGQVSLKEAKEIYVSAEGDIGLAKRRFKEKRENQINSLLHMDNNKKNVAEALFQANGKEHEARTTLEVQLFLKKNPDFITHLKQHPTKEEYLKDLEQLKDDKIEMKKRIRMIMGEFKMSNGRAKMCLNSIIDLGSDIYDTVILSQDTSDPNLLHRRLNVECNMCYEKYSQLKIINLVHCECKLCWECYAGFLEYTIKNEDISKLSCPKCGLPKIEHGLREHFEHIEQQIIHLVKKEKISKEVKEIYQRKLQDFFLSAQPNFRWCSHCQQGFLWENERVLKMNCPGCLKSTCFGCKEQWEDQHEGLTCEQYKQWKIDNDADVQTNAVDQLLQHNCIVCPKCKMRYELARGGCMHFICRACKHQYCSGCYNTFHANKNECDYFENCDLNCLHAHHPRNCAYYTRDLTIDELKTLLDDVNVEYPTEIPEERKNEENIRCDVLLQDDNYKDQPCNGPILENTAGMCKKHYLERLTMLLFFNRVDPIKLYNIGQITNLYRRERKQLPDKLQSEADGDYLKRLLEITPNEIPLPEINNVFPKPRAQPPIVNDNDENSSDDDEE